MTSSETFKVLEIIDNLSRSKNFDYNLKFLLRDFVRNFKIFERNYKHYRSEIEEKCLDLDIFHQKLTKYFNLSYHNNFDDLLDKIINRGKFRSQFSESKMSEVIERY